MANGRFFHLRWKEGVYFAGEGHFDGQWVEAPFSTAKTKCFEYTMKGKIRDVSKTGSGKD